MPSKVLVIILLDIITLKLKGDISIVESLNAKI